jgi:hypothetical protein
MALPSGASASASAASGTPSSDTTGGRMLTQNEAIAAGVYTEHQAGASDGSVTYQYDFADGLTVTSVQPPPGFRPLTATNDELMKYGFPVRPTGAAALASWTQAMAEWRTAVTPRLAVQISSTPNVATGSFAIINNTNTHGPWAGYVDDTNSQAFTGAQSTFAAPTLGSGCGTPGAMSIWTGLGGYNSGQFIQSGIAAGENLTTGADKLSVWQPFWELIRSTKTWPPRLLKGATGAIAISPGDTVFSKTTYTSSTGGKASFYIENDTSGASSSYTISTNALTGSISTYYDGSTADFVAEDPPGGAVPVPFSEFAMTKSQADKNGTWGSLADDNPVRLRNTQSNPGPIGSTGEAFAVGYDGCGTY